MYLCAPDGQALYGIFPYAVQGYAKNENPVQYWRGGRTHYAEVSSGSSSRSSLRRRTPLRMCRLAARVSADAGLPLPASASVPFVCWQPRTDASRAAYAMLSLPILSPWR